MCGLSRHMLFTMWYRQYLHLFNTHQPVWCLHPLLSCFIWAMSSKPVQSDVGLWVSWNEAFCHQNKIEACDWLRSICCGVTRLQGTAQSDALHSLWSELICLYSATIWGFWWSSLVCHVFTTPLNAMSIFIYKDNSIKLNTLLYKIGPSQNALVNRFPLSIPNLKQFSATFLHQSFPTGICFRAFQSRHKWHRSMKSYESSVRGG